MTSTTAHSRDPLNEDLLVLFDGHALFHRSFHAIHNSMSVSGTGEQTAAVFGFTASILKTVAQLKPAYAAFAFDLPTPTFRHKSYDAYKAQRPSMPDIMRDQFGRIRQVVQTLGLPIFELEGFEADDVLGCLARRATEHGLRTIIVTGDTDTMQLVSPTVSILLHRGAQAETVFGVEAVRERYDLEPEQIAHLKAVQGDPSDNIAGVRGVGTKTATALLKRFGTVDGIYDHLNEVTPERVREQMRDGEDQARMGLALTTIVTDLPLDVDFPRLRWTENLDRGQLISLFGELEFTSLVSRIPAFIQPGSVDGVVSSPHPDGGVIADGDGASLGRGPG
ncbi:MAG: DNA polymerase I, partial [Chloroflexi bacterium]|nr:DNA polymerase I [Chloroflexota bacterium]